MFGNFFDKILGDDEEDLVDNKDSKRLHSKKIPIKIPFWETISVSLIFASGLAYRLWFMFYVSGVDNAGAGWYGDTYHHWQIGYLTAKVGLHNGFLRLWDLKGMEYFWGPLHPLLYTIMFFITGGSTSLAVVRIVSGLFGLGSLILLYVLVKRYWGRATGLAVLFFGAFFPVAVFNDISGMLEPIGLFFLLLGVYFWPTRPLITGFMWAIATTARAEAWIFSLGLLFGLMFLNEKADRKIMAVVGWAVPMVVYMKYLLDATGNAIYPVYWNFMANGLGVWADMKRTLTPLQIFMRPILIGCAAVSALALLVVLYRRRQSAPLLLLGWGNIFFVGAFMGIGHYLSGWEWWFPVIRFFVFPYIFIALLIFSLFSKIRFGRPAFWNLLLATLVIIVTGFSQLSWKPIMDHFSTTVGTWEQNVIWAKQLKSDYTGGKILFPEGEPNFTYAIVRYAAIDGTKIVGQMFDPYYYHGGMEMYIDWKKNRNIILDWFKENEISLAVFRVDNERYQELVRREPLVFEKLTVLNGGVYDVWRVNYNYETETK